MKKHNNFFFCFVLLKWGTNVIYISLYDCDCSLGI